MADEQRNPYVGPRTFEEDDAQFFFGREREARELLSLVISEPLVLFYAESGAGKSSIINTRLIPGLREERFFLLPTGRVGGNLPDELDDVPNIFVFNLLASLDKGKNTPQALADLTIVEYLRMFKMSSAEEDDTFYDEEGDESARVLIIDQFEEIVTTNLDRWQDRAGFFEQLSEAIKEDQLLWVVLTLREDYVAGLEPYARMMPNRLRARFYMQRMKSRAAEQAIERPAALADRPFAAGVARQLVDNLRQLRTGDGDEVRLGEYVEPVQLQVVCYQLWNNLQGRPLGEITAQDLEELGNVDQALGEFYEEALAAVLSEVQVSEVDLRNWFERHLITEAGTRGTVYQGAAETAGMPNEVVRLLADQYLLRAEPRAGGMWYELVHDRFVEPILLANQAWRLRQSPLLRAAEEWDRSGRERSKLYGGNRLAEALASGAKDQMEPIVQAFLIASEEAESQQKLEAAQEAAAEQRRRADEQARTARRLRSLTGGLVVVVLVAIVIAAYAFVQQGRAATNEQAALNNAIAASTSEAAALENGSLAATEAARALENLDAAATSAADAVNAQATSAVALEAAENAADAARIRESEARDTTSQLQTREAQSIELLDVANGLVDLALANLTPTPSDPEFYATQAAEFVVAVGDFESDSACKQVALFDYVVVETSSDYVPPGDEFELLMILLNDTRADTCPWESGLTLRMTSGERFRTNDFEFPLTDALWLQGNQAIPLEDSGNVLGGQSVELRIPNLVAPSSAEAESETTWQLFKPDGKRFGPSFTTNLFASPDYDGQNANGDDQEEFEDVEFDFFENNCEERENEWECEILITPFGGSGKYEVIVYDDEPPSRYNAGSSAVVHKVKGENCSAWGHEIEVVDRETGQNFIDVIVVDPIDLPLFGDGLACGER